MTRKIFFAVLLLQSLLCFGLGAQTQISFTPEVDGELLDLVSYEERVQLVSSQGLYDLNLTETQLVQSLGDREILKPLQATNPHQKRMYYPLSDSSLVVLKRSRLITQLESQQGIFLKTSGGNTWLVTDSIYLDKGENRYDGFEAFESFNPPGQYYTDGAAIDNQILLSTAELGVIKITRPKGTDDYKIHHYNESNGLYSNHATTLQIFNKDEFGVGHPDGVSFVSYGKVRYQDLSTHATSPVIQMAKDQTGRYWAATEDRLFLIFKKGYRPVDLQLEMNEDIRRIVLRPDNSLFVMTNERIHIVPYIQEEELEVVNSNQKQPVCYYSIRNKNYYSDGQMVYCLRPEDETWEPHPKKQAPLRTIKDARGNTTLVFKNNKCLKLSGRSATRLSKFSIPDGEELVNICKIGTSKYYCTGSNLYEGNNAHFKLINDQNDRFYKVIESEEKKYAFGATGIYLIDGEEVSPLLASYKNSRFPLTYNQFLSDGKLVTFDENNLKILDEATQGMVDVNVSPLKILDIKEVDAEVWILCKKSLLAVRKSTLLEGKFDIIQVIPHYKELEKGTLELEGDSKMVIVSNNSIIKVDLEERQTYVEPTIRIAKVKTVDGNVIKATKGQFLLSADDLPVQFQFCSDNYWTDNIKYSYHVNHDGKNSSEWKQVNLFNFDADENGKYTLVAKYKDDIYGSKVTSKPILINVSDFLEDEQVELSTTVKPSPIILISLLLLCSIVFLWRKFS